jgi:hypothetical protein
MRHSLPWTYLCEVQRFQNKLRHSVTPKQYVYRYILQTTKRQVLCSHHATRHHFPNFIQGVSFKTQSKQPSRTMVTEMKSEAVPPYNGLSIFAGDCGISVTLIVRLVLTPSAQTRCKCEQGVFAGQNVYLASNTASRRNSLLLFVEYLAIRILTRKYRIK